MKAILPRAVFSGLLALLVLLFSLSAFTANEDAPAKDFVRAKTRKALGIIRQYGAALTGEDKCVVFALDAADFYRPYRLISLCVTDKNKANPAKVFMRDFYEKIASVEPISLGDVGVGSPGPPAAAAGLVFGLQVREVHFNELYVMATKFDAKGKPQGSLQTLSTIAAPSEKYFTRENMTATRGKNSVGIVAAALVLDEQDNEEGAVVYFMETDFDGKVIREPTELNLPEDGALQSIRLGKPFQDGKWWRIPATSIDYKDKDNGVTAPYIGASGHALMVLSVKPRKKGCLSKYSKLNGDNVEYDEYLYSGLQFLPPTQPAGVSGYPAAATLDLFYQYEKSKRPTQDNPLSSDFYYYVQAVRNGKRRGKPVEVNIPDWEPDLQYNQNDDVYCFELVSNVVVDNEGNFVVGLNSSLNIRSYSAPGEIGIGSEATWRWTERISWHKFNRNGDVTDSGYIAMSPDKGSYRSVSRFAYLDEINMYNYLFTSGGGQQDREIRFVTILANVDKNTADPLSSEVGIWKIPD